MIRKRTGNRTGSSSATSTGTAVVAVALEAELEEAQRQLRSGRVSILESSSVPTTNNRSGLSSLGRGASNFVESFEAEFDRITDALRATEHSIESTARAILLNADALSRKDDDCTVTAIDELRSQARQLSDRVLQLNNQTLADANELRRIATLADPKLGTSCVATTERRLDSDPWTFDHSGGGLVVVLLSDIYFIIRDIEGKKKAKADSAGSGGPSSSKDNAKWVAPSSFERVTTKYWVHDQDLSQVMLASVAELPLLVYGRKGGRILDQKDARRRQSEANQSDNSLWTSLASSISSVYFDSPGMHMYTERLKRSEGAQLFRIRWYGTKPQGDEIIFLELKTHHEKWIGDTSVKERVGICEKDVPQLLDTSNGSWDTQRASDLVRMANPTEDQNSIRDLSNLLLKIRALICKLNLTPCVRTKYTRVALQPANTNRIRLTIDRDITMINERATKSSNSWCLDDDDTIPHDDIVKMPYCVFEVKVAGTDGSPRFITELEDSKGIVEAKKFSKFLSGSSIFNASKIKSLPWWATDAAFVPLYEKNNARSSAAIVSSADRASAFGAPGATLRPSAIDIGAVPPLPPPKSGTTRDMSRSSSPTCSTSSTTHAAKLGDDTFAQEIEKSGQRQNRASRRRSSIRMSLPRMSIHQQNEVSPFEQRVASKAPAKVEPKSYFANERTFIQWISAALLFVTISQILYILAAQSNVKEASIAATWMIAMSLFISVYALAIYYRRINLMKNGKPYGYIDFVGPGVLTASIVSGVILLIVYSYQAQSPAAVSTMTNQSGQCIRRSLTGVPIMEMQPSGVAIDEAKGLALVPSLHRIVALRDGLPTDEVNASPVQVVATLPGTNLEALEYVGHSLYALSEEDGFSEIIALKWVNGHLDSRYLSEVHRWKINLRGAEGMALVPSEDEGSAPKLIVAGELFPTTGTSNTNEGILLIDVFDLDSFDDDEEKIEKSSKMNKNLIAKGLNDEKVGSMQYFEGLLYILFDNDRVIRAFDTKTGKIVQETPLPIAELGSERDWEGMRLQRIPENNIIGRGLRGSAPPGTLVLHLALDTPAQVWSLRLNEEGGGSERWTLPRCAG